MKTTVEFVPMRCFRAALRDLKQDCRDHRFAIGFGAPTLALTEDRQAVEIKVLTLGIGFTHPAFVEVPLLWGALRLTFPFRRTLQRLGNREITRASTMTCEEWTRVQEAARLGLVAIVRDHGWAAELTDAGLAALRGGWIAI